MSVTTHIVEVIRQGIWASLTGGWYYEPGYSMFTNTVHLYVWLLLLLFPLLIGVFASGAMSITLLVSYISFTVFMFTFIKLTVTYMHMIFDTTDPIVVTKTINDSIDEIFRDSEQPAADIEMIEMRDMGLQMRNLDRSYGPRMWPGDQANRRRTQDSGGGAGGRTSCETSRRVRIEEEQEVEEDKEEQKEEEEEDDDEIDGMKVIRPDDKTNMRQRSAPNILHRPLLGCSSDVRRRSSEPVVQFRIQLEDEPVHVAALETPKTEPSSVPTRRRSSRRRSSTGTTASTSSGRRRANRRAGSPAVFAGSLIRSRDSQESSRSMPSSIGFTPVVVSLGSGGNELDRPTTSRYSADDAENGSDIKVEITKFLEELIDKHPETLDAIESVRMSRLGRIRQSQEALQRPSESPAASSSSANYMFGVPNALRNVARRSSPFVDWNAGTSQPSSSSYSHHHIAQGHEDTTQGSVHSFQDDDGTWWTYTFDENGIGTAQPLGSGRAIMDLLNRGGTTTGSEKKHQLEALPECMYDSTDDEKEDDTEEEEEDVNIPSTSKAHDPIPLTRRDRALSSSSNESCTYMPTLPSSVFHAPSGTGATRTTSTHGNQIVCFTAAASRLRSALGSGSNEPSQTQQQQQQQSETEPESVWQMEQIMDLIESNNGRRDSAPRGIRTQHNDAVFRSQLESYSQGPSRYRFLSDVAFSSLHPIQTPSTGQQPDFSRRPSNIRKSYYYQMKMFPKVQKSFNLKLDRPSVDRLFDRNRFFYSFIFDVLLGAIVSALAAIIIFADIYYELAIVFFAFVVASAHFSLLKSVQPDAASPIHGFNWIVSYNRPIYFVLLSTLLVYLHYLSGNFPTTDSSDISWKFESLMTEPLGFIVAARDLVSVFLLLLPIAFTLGWLPQINTLVHHVFEQIEMHIFGGTASFGVFSAFIQLVKSVFVYSILCIFCRIANNSSPKSTQNPIFSAFIATTIALSYLLSRMSSNQQLTVVLMEILISPIRKITSTSDEDEEKKANNGEDTPGPRFTDEMPATVRRTVFQRARYDLLFSIFLVLFFFALHSTSLFTATQPYLTRILAVICVILGTFNHYIYPQLRTHTPWCLISQPILRSAEHQQFESPDAAKLMVFEVIHMWMVAIERNIFYPMLVTSMMTENNWSLNSCVIPLCALRLLRGSFSQPQLMFIPIGFACMATYFDFKTLPDSSSYLPLIAYLSVAVYPKIIELYLKINFIMVYVAPWQISWGSAFHAFAQPFSVPHSALIAVQTVISSVISAPLNPFLGSSFFTASYVRPVKFWERDYNTKRSDASNTRLASQIDRGPMMDDSNLNAIFYEHLTRSLQKSLAADLAMGRWSTSVEPGDCFILASFYLNCLVHIIEVGNGFVTFQLRGLEFRGTYCHQREVEAISEDIRDGTGCCCCAPGSIPGFLSLNTAFGLRWLAWEVVSGKYIIDGYSISDNSAVNLLQVHELRRLLVTLYIKCIIYYAIKSSKLTQWLNDAIASSSIRNVMSVPKYVDLDSMFCSTNDDDYDNAEGGISRDSFTAFYESWITFCVSERAEEKPEETLNKQEKQDVIGLCYLLSLVARRSLGTAAYNRHSSAAESFLYGLHALFKGDFRITCVRDEWVFCDMDLLRCVVSPAVKMALKLHQDHFAHFEEFDDHKSLYTCIGEHQTNMFISHEQDPGWRKSILANTPSLLALRHVYDDGQDDYKIIMLNKMHLNMRVIKLNRECVRAFWAGQQQELIFLRNRNPERGSIQNARQVLRNMINSSADQPVGYPIYVSPLTTSHIESHSQIERIFGPCFTFEGLRDLGRTIWNMILNHFGPSGSTSAHQQQSIQMQQIQPQSQQQSSSAVLPPTPRVVFRIGTPTHDAVSIDDTDADQEVAAITQHIAPQPAAKLENSIVEMTKDGGARVSVVPGPSSRKTDSSTEIRPSIPQILKSNNILGESREICVGAWIQIADPEHIFQCLNEPLKSTGECLVVWPDETIQSMSGRSSWLYRPGKGMCGRILYTWYPNHPLKAKRSHVGDYIHLISIPSMGNGLVPISEKGCRLLNIGDPAFNSILGSTMSEHTEFHTRYIDALILLKIVPGLVSQRNVFTKKPPFPPTVASNPATSSSSSANPPPSSVDPAEPSSSS